MVILISNLFNLYYLFIDIIILYDHKGLTKMAKCESFFSIISMKNMLITNTWLH